MRSQIFFVPFFDVPPEEGTITYESGLSSGLVINCETDEETLENLKSVSAFDFYYEVMILKDDESFPSIESRRNSLIESYLKEKENVTI
jgi:hypothetical protein